MPVQQHNALIISIFDARSFKRPPTPPPEKGPEVGGPPRKRRRLFPYQGPDEPEEPLISDRLRTWALSVGKQERDRLRQIQNMPAPIPRPRLATDEIIRERGVVLLPERNGKQYWAGCLQVLILYHRSTRKSSRSTIDVAFATTYHRSSEPNQCTT